MRFVDDTKFDRVGCFMYSQEENTKAGTLPNQVDEKTKQRRHDMLMELNQKISRAKHKEWIGRTIDVMVEGVSDETELLLTGRNSHQAPDIDGVTYINDGVANPGDIVKVQISDAMDYDLIGGIVADS